MQYAKAKGSATTLCGALRSLNGGVGLNDVGFQVWGFTAVIDRAALKALAVTGFTTFQAGTLLPMLGAPPGQNHGNSTSAN